MSSHTFSVSDPADGRCRLPDWAATFVLYISSLRQRGDLEKVGRLLRVSRQGGYCGLDVFVFLLAMFCWPRPDRRTRAVKAFGAATSFCGRGLAALAGRRNWPGQSAVSRFLAVVPAGEMLLDFGADQLIQGAEPLLRHPDAQHYDTLGEAWHVLDFDPTVIAVRERALPEGEDLPPPTRRVSAICAPGYTGRKRGEVQVSAGCLQHAGTGLWLQIMLEPGNAVVSAMLAKLLGKLDPWLDAAGATRERTLVRADGAAGNLPSVKAFSENGVHFLTRFACYGLLDRPQVQAHLRGVRWLAVPDSGSGPRRQVAELGHWPWGDAPLLQDMPEGLEKARIVISRFAATSKHGAGTVRDGWQYELFGTSLDPAAWPAPEVVELYYGRAALENRFAQAAAELGIDRLFSTALGGQWLVMLVGLMVMNLRTILGAKRVGPLPIEAVQPQPRVEIVAAEPEPEPEPEPEQPPEPEPEPVYAPPPNALAQIVAELDLRDWSAWTARHPGWRWLVGHGVLCAQQKLLAPIRIRLRAHKPPTLRLRARQTDCMACPQRDPCFAGAAPERPRREIHVGIATLASVRSGAFRAMQKSLDKKPRSPVARPKPQHVPTRQLWQPPTPVVAGPWATRTPRIVPTVFRQGVYLAVRDARVDVEIVGDRLQQTPPAWLARSSGSRQRRRLTWSERLARNALAAGARVHAAMQTVDRWVMMAVTA